ncbi:MAG: hypothetical protein BGP06_06000 [Rhizobiales bacterium 65-9]|nr:4'-phosphopantetheinyl transferase superfamily protein [Hyphomicrobiales bacterium]OJY35415.1 MAG: hypothetical protein BGP06_06000 [Rhizobiales bacterium 65-9]
MTAPVLALPQASAYLIPGAPRGGRAHYQLASETLSAAAGRAIAVGRRPSGRPRLDAPDAELGVSLSYRDGALLVGYSPTHQVGVDIEPDDEALDVQSLARDHFAPREAVAVASMKSIAAQRDLFLRLWVAKEAVLKATGRGVHDGLDQPDFGGSLAALGADREAVPFDASSRVPAGSVIVARVAAADAPALYLALATING